jgi:flagellar hook-length control protein FliK
MNASHIVSMLIVPARAGAGAQAAPFLPGAAPDEPVDFSQLFADLIPEQLPEAVPQEKGKESEKEPAHSEKAEDPVLLLGLPVLVPQETPKAAVADEVKAKSPEALPAVAAKPEKPLEAAKQPELRAERVKEPAPIQPDVSSLAAKEAAPLAAAAHVDAEAPQLLQAQPAQHAQSSARPSLPVAAPVGTPQWREEFSAAVRVIAVERIQSAEIHLNPPELGPVQVSLRVEAKEATVAFVTQHADTGQALEAALPRLRELLEESGLSLGEASVDVAGSGGFAREGAQQDQAQGRMQAFGTPAQGPSEPGPAAQATLPARSPRLVDTFA